MNGLQLYDKIENPHGRGWISVQQQADNVVFSRLTYSYPLKLLSPKLSSLAAVAYIITFGGGLVGGDWINLSAEVGRSTTLLLLTQVSLSNFTRSPSD